jgi:general secretion pathway protein A
VRQLAAALFPRACSRSLHEREGHSWAASKLAAGKAPLAAALQTASHCGVLIGREASDSLQRPQLEMKELDYFGSRSSGTKLLDYYGLHSQPFGVTPDPRYLYLSSTHRRALSDLAYGIESARGFLVLTAEPGLGKTTLLFLLLTRLERANRTAFIFQTPSDPREFLLYLLADLGIKAEDQELTFIKQRLHEAVAAEARSGRRLVVVIDEAHILQSPVFDTVVRLSDFEAPLTGSLQVVVAGQSELAQKLAQPAFSGFRQRVSTLARLDPLTVAESNRYIDHRLQMAGHSRNGLFSSDARQAIAAWSDGIPRKINTICFNALLRGYARKKESIDASTVQDAIADLDWVDFCGRAAKQSSCKSTEVREGKPDQAVLGMNQNV